MERMDHNTGRFNILKGMHKALLEDGYVFLDGKYSFSGKTN